MEIKGQLVLEGRLFLSLGAEVAVSAMRAIKLSCLIKGSCADLEAELSRVREYNR